MKRLVDILAAVSGLVVFAPILLILSLLIRKALGSPVLFKQMRPGLHGEPFSMIKFRTMSDQCDAEGNLLPDEERMNRFSQILRSTSLDELPELWNVLKGDMSLVGPRPLLMEYLPLYSDEQRRRMDVRPGITGWAQINGRNALSWEEKFELDVWYVDNRTFLLDMKIILLTLYKVVAREGISAVDNTIMPKFKGVRSMDENGAGPEDP